MHETGCSGPVYWDNPEGWHGKGGWRGSSEWGTHVHPWLSHVSVWQKPLQYCKVIQFSSVQSFSNVRLFAAPWIAAHQYSLSITNSRSPLKLKSIESVMPSSHLILCHLLLLLPPTPPSIRVFSNKSTLRMRWPKYWSFSFSIIPSKEIPGLISFRMDWLDLLAVQETLKSLLQHHVSFQSQRKAMSKNAQTTAQLYSSHVLVKIKKRLMQMLPWWWKERVRGPDWSLFQYELSCFPKWSEIKVLIICYPLSFEDSQSRKLISGPSRG